MNIARRHSFIRQYKLDDVCGRCDYIGNPDRQEYLYATYSTVEPEFWKELAEQNQHDFKRSNAMGKCIEARELVIALPESFQEYDRELLLQLFAEQFRSNYGVQCTAALHHNKKKTNYHIHLIYSERKVLEKKEIKRASRNMFYDEKGKHVRTKKEILDENGNVRQGCYIIPKGEIYEMSFFDSKEEIFKKHSFLNEVKQMYTDLINQLVKDEAEKLSVFEPDGPYLATKKIGKNNPKAEEIQADNEARQEWNRTVDEALVAGVASEEIAAVKKENISLPVKESIQKEGQKPGLLRQVLKKAVAVLREKIRSVIAPEKPELKVNMEVFRQMQGVRRKLFGLMKKIKGIDVEIIEKQRRLDELSGLSGAFHLKEKKELMNSISALITDRTRQSSLLKETVNAAGYRSVDSFMRAFDKSHALVEEYLKIKDTDANKSSSSKQMQEKKQSVLEKLQKYDQEAKRSDSFSKRRKTVPKKGMEIE
ncbi:MAG: MobA/MobL family protein [Schaedlerella sp.]|nr:MobA/MobL family protein [Lachnospiraceae bacterium]MDY4202147.1 MobA/MobL family protein [Schaedlerella sp.]